MSDYTPQPNEVRADFITLHTRNFDAYQAGRSLTSEQEVYGDVFDRMIAEVRREAAEKALTETANELDRIGNGLVGGLSDWLRARAEAYRQERKEQ